MLLAMSGVSMAQSPISVQPATFSPDDSITITYDASKGNAALANYSGDVYMYGGVITNQSAFPTQWQHTTPATWSSYPAATKLTSLGNNLYRIKILPRSYYSMGATETLRSLVCLFRNNTGTLVGREVGNADIYYQLPNPFGNNMYWWNDATFYQIFVRSFKDSNGDGIGDFQGIISKLGYLQDLGIKAIWLMPIHPSPSYHGYDVNNYKAVNPQYGTMQDFKALVDSAHNRGIKIVIDWVVNHTSTQHPWFVQSAANNPQYSNFYRWSPTAPTYLGPWGQTVWAYNNVRAQYYYSIFWSGMPDLNYGTQAVKDSIFSAAKFWLQNTNIDGFRCDGAMYISEDGTNLMNIPANHAYWSEFKNYYKSINPNAMSVGEIWTNTHTVASYNNELDFCFEFDLAESILNAVNSGSASNLKNQIETVEFMYANSQYGTFLTNHDQNRVIDVLGGNREKAKAAAGILLTLPGVPFVYYGEEVSMKGSKPDENIRLPMQWTNGTNAGFTTGTPWRALNNDASTYNVQTLAADPNSIYNLYKKLIALRNQEAALRKGACQVVNTNKSWVAAYVRKLGNDYLLVMTNASANPVSTMTVNLATTGISSQANTTWTELLSDSTQSYALNSTQVLSGVRLGAYQTKVFKLQNFVSVSEETSLPTHWQLWPNPNNGIFYLKNTAMATESKATVQLYDTTGKVLQSQVYPLQNGQMQLNISHLPSAVYILKITTKKQSSTLRVIK